MRFAAVTLLAPAIAVSVALGGCSHATAGTGDRASKPRRGVLWRGDYQTRNFKQWHSLQAVPGGATIITSPTVHRWRYTARYVVRSGDDPIGSNGERAEARASQTQTGGSEGQERWYGWSTLFPTNADLPPSNDSWNIFTQWHQTSSDGCAPNIAFQADTSHSPPAIKVRVLGGASNNCSPSSTRLLRPAQLTLGHWYDFVVHVKWSSDPSIGFIEGWIDRANVIPKIQTATLYKGQGAYLKQGFYRASSDVTSTVYHVGTRAGRSYKAVTP
jgi:hypothetical protein